MNLVAKFAKGKGGRKVCQEGLDPACRSLPRIRLRQNRRRNILHLTRDEQRGAADHANLRLAIFIGTEPRDILRDDQIIAAARIEGNEFHYAVSCRPVLWAEDVAFA